MIGRGGRENQHLVCVNLSHHCLWYVKIVDLPSLVRRIRSLPSLDKNRKTLSSQWLDAISRLTPTAFYGSSSTVGLRPYIRAADATELRQDPSRAFEPRGQVMKRRMVP